MGRLAPVQVLFWGNPVTSGSPSIDYFVSADVMEDPHGRTRMHPSQVHDIYLYYI
jgi:predicted O-linked N-acetylglucosamine transferase (SPINDLY family)